jgi:hypothetical protein
MNGNLPSSSFRRTQDASQFNPPTWKRRLAQGVHNTKSYPGHVEIGMAHMAQLFVIYFPFLPFLGFLLRGLTPGMPIFLVGLDLLSAVPFFQVLSPS